METYFILKRTLIPFRKCIVSRFNKHCTRNGISHRTIFSNCYLAGIFIEQNRKILHFTLFVFCWHFIRINPNIKHVSNSINNLRSDMTLRHRNVTEIHLIIKDLYHKARKEAFLCYIEK